MSVMVCLLFVERAFLWQPKQKHLVRHRSLIRLNARLKK
jgi:hypothetical protein